MTPDWGDVPTWLATAGAGVAVVYAVRAHRMERKRDDVAEALLLSEQARKVAVWGEAADPPHDESEGRFIEVLRLLNASDLPVYDYVVQSYLMEGNSDIEQATPDRVYGFGGDLPPSPQAEKQYLSLARVDHSWAYAIQFRDASGRTWHRDRFGSLVQGPFPDEGHFQPAHYYEPYDL